jgi:hypothetical protein
VFVLINISTFICSRDRKGQHRTTVVAAHMQRWVDEWQHAANDVWHEVEVWDQSQYEAYLEWYLPRTRVRVTHTPREVTRHTSSFGDTYPVHRDQSTAYGVCIVISIELYKFSKMFVHLSLRKQVELMKEVAVESATALSRMSQGSRFSGSEISQILKRIYEKATKAVRSCCTTEAVRTLPQGGSAQRPPRPTYRASSSATVSESPHTTPQRPWRPTFVGMSSPGYDASSSQTHPPFRPPQFGMGMPSSFSLQRPIGTSSKQLLELYLHMCCHTEVISECRFSVAAESCIRLTC